MTRSLAQVTLEILEDRTTLRVHAGKALAPEDLLRRAIEALQEELSDLKYCPYHSSSRQEAVGQDSPCPQSQTA